MEPKLEVLLEKITKISQELREVESSVREMLGTALAERLSPAKDAQLQASSGVPSEPEEQQNPNSSAPPYATSPRTPPPSSGHTYTAGSSSQQEGDVGFFAESPLIKYSKEELKMMSLYDDEDYPTGRAFVEQQNQSVVDGSQRSTFLGAEDCRICFMEKSEGTVYTLQSCGHDFHLHCLARCIGSRSIQNKCTICQKNFTAAEMASIVKQDALEVKTSREAQRKKAASERAAAKAARLRHTSENPPPPPETPKSEPVAPAEESVIPLSPGTVLRELSKRLSPPDGAEARPPAKRKRQRKKFQRAKNFAKRRSNRTIKPP